MSKYRVAPTERFLKDMKHYIKKKKYHKLRDDMDKLVEDLEEGNLVGDEIPGLGLPKDESSYKLRMANNTTKIGKSGAFRIIYYVIKNSYEIYLLTVYEKADTTNLNSGEIKKLIHEYC